MHLNQITGIDDSQLADFDDGNHVVRVHQSIVKPLTNLIEVTASVGIELRLASAHRNFERQLAIWNGKFSQQRPVFNRGGELVDLSVLDSWQKVQAIMLFSAIPGTSRHHWGTDIDVYDVAAINPEYQLQLSPEEYQSTGPFAHLTKWLEDELPNTGFFRPYLVESPEHIGVAYEPWHLSYRPTAQEIERTTLQQKRQLKGFILESEILGKDEIVQHFDFIFDHYIQTGNRR